MFQYQAVNASGLFSSIFVARIAGLLSDTLVQVLQLVVKTCRTMRQMATGTAQRCVYHAWPAKAAARIGTHDKLLAAGN